MRWVWTRAPAVFGAVLLAVGAAVGQEPPSHDHEHHAGMRPEESPARPGLRRLAPTRAPMAFDVGPDREIETIGEALERSVDGDTIRVHAGVYEERVVIRAAVALLGIGDPIIDGGGTGTVVTVEAPAEIRGLVIRASGADQSREDSGIMVLAADSVRIEDNRLTDVLFGVYVKQSQEPVIRGNRIEGKDRPIPRRGDGVRLWYCSGGVVENNELVRTRDLVIWFTEGLEILNNRVTHGRYGLHYMYSDHNVFVGNVFAHNDVGAFLMYSKDIRIRGNRFEKAAGASGIGLGLKDSDDIFASDNTFIGNEIGVFLDNSPTSVDGRNEFRDNLVAANDAGVVLLPSVHSNEFTGNAWIGNTTPVVVSGGGDALKNRWAGNHWSGYAGFDADADGTGDAPFQHHRVSDDLFARHPDLRFLAGSPAVSALEVLARLFPLLAPRPVVIDSLPVASAPAFAVAGLSFDPQSDAPRRGGITLAAVLMWAASLSAVVAIFTLARRRRA